MRSIRLYRIGLISTFRFGLVLGLILNFLPTMIFTFLVLWGTSLLVRWMANLSASLPLPGGLSLPISTIELLGLQDALRVLQGIAGLAAWQIAALSILLWLAAAFTSGVLALIVASVFNIIAQMAGGIQVTVDEADLLPGPRPAAPGMPGRALAAPIGAPNGAPYEAPHGISPAMSPAMAQTVHQGAYFEVIAPQPGILPVNPPGTVIGSDPSAGIVLGGLAARHAQVAFQRGRVLLIDLGAGNLWVRERPAEQVNLLEDGTLVQIGPWQMIFRAQRG